MQERLIGTSVPRKEARDKVTGHARYVDDIAFPGMIYGATVRSKAARGKIRAIHYGAGIPWEEVTIVTAKDIPGTNVVHLINDDQPCLADGFVNHPEEAVVLLAHPNRELLERARAAVTIDIEAAPAVFTIEESIAKKAIVWGEDNVFKQYLIEKGDIDAAFRAADLVVTGHYETGAQEHLYIETNGIIATFDGIEGVTVWGSLQCPYYIQKALMPLFGVEPSHARIVQLETGGGFGGKEEYPSMIASHAALLAHKARRPVKIIYDRGEDMAATTKRHPSRTLHRTAVKRDGTILAFDIDFAIDGGAYSTLSQVVLSRGSIHAAGPYEVPNVRVLSRAMATNSPPHGAFRGFGAPQSIFALECHLDEIARTLGMSPEALRRKNFVAKGGTLATGQTVRDDVDMNALLDRAFEASGYHEKRARFELENKANPTIKRGIGFATFLHGTGFTGSGEKFLASIVGVEATPKGHVRVLAASTEIGQGTNTVFAQIAGDALGVAYDVIEIAQPDTKNVPNSGPTVASRTVTIVGKLVETAALALKKTLVASGVLAETYSSDEFVEACADYVARFGPLRENAEYKQPPYIQWDDTKLRGDAYGAYSWAVYVASVKVDLVTFETTVEDFVALQEVGKVIHPVLAAGQVEGGVAQGIGWALYENVAWKDGRMANDRMTDYIMPTSVDLPPIRTLFAEAPYTYGPSGAKGIGELPMDGPAPAIVNAVADATHVLVPRVPVTPEVLMDAFLAALATKEVAHGG